MLGVWDAESDGQICRLITLRAFAAVGISQDAPHTKKEEERIEKRRISPPVLFINIQEKNEKKEQIR